MFDQFVVRSMVSGEVFSRAKRLLSAGRVRHVLAGGPDDDLFIMGRVGSQSSEGLTYDSYVRVNTKTGALLEASCDCPAAMTYSGPCKHCTALMLYYAQHQDDPDVRDALNGTDEAIDTSAREVSENEDGAAWEADHVNAGSSQQGSQPESDIAQVDLSSHPVRHRRTGTDTLALLQQYSPDDDDADSESIADLFGTGSRKVELIPYTSIDNDNGKLVVEFKLGIDRLYVMRSVSSFVHAVENHSLVRYGKFLEFRHVKAAFTPQSQKFVDFLMQIIEVREEDRRNSWIYYPQYTDERYLTLNQRELDFFIAAAVEAGRFHYYSVNTRAHTAVDQFITVMDDLPRFHMSVERDEDGSGIHFQLKTGSMRLLFGSQYAYFFEPERVHRAPLSAMEDILPFLDYVDQGRSGYIAEEDIPAFTQNLLPVVAKYADITTRDFNPALYQAPTVRFRLNLDLPQPDMITADLVAIYETPAMENSRQTGSAAGSEAETGFTPERAADPFQRNTGNAQEFSVFRRSKKRSASARAEESIRSFPEEVRKARAIAPYFQAYDQKAGLAVYQGDEEQIAEFIVQTVPALEAIVPVYLSEKLRRVNIVENPRIQVGVSLHQDLLRLDLVSDDLSLEDIAEILSRYDPKKRFYRLRQGDIVQFAGDELEELARLQDGLQLSPAQIRKGALDVPSYRAMYLDALSESRDMLQFSLDGGFRHLVERMKPETAGNNSAEDSIYTIPASLQNVMRDYQKEGFQWLARLKENGFGGILADEMGLGKTLQVLSLLLAEKNLAEGNTAGLDHSESVLTNTPTAITAAKRTGGIHNTAARHGPHTPHTLIVCPASLVYNWANEIQRFTPELNYVLAVGSKSCRRAVIEDMDENGTNIIVTSYDILRRDIDLYEGVHFDNEVLDEAQFIKNPTTQQAKAVKAVDASFRVALTGTPIENRLSELWSIFDYLMPGFLFSYQKFRQKFEVPAMEEMAARQEAAGEEQTASAAGHSEVSSGSPHVPGSTAETASASLGKSSVSESTVTPGTGNGQVSGVSAESTNQYSPLSSLRMLTSPFILRRRKRDVLKDLPEKMEETVFARMDSEQHDLYQAHMQRLKVLLSSQSDEEFKTGKIMILSELTRLRQLCCDPGLVYKDYKGNSCKSDVCLDLVESAIEGGHKILLFSQFTSMFDLLIPRLEQRGIRYYLLTGSTPKKDRVEMAEAFNRGAAEGNADAVPLFLISLKAGGTGLNLTAADIVIHYDPWWNVAVENQATDRAHRIGQKNVVTVYKLIAKDTIEERIQQLQETKHALADEILSGDEISTASLSREDLLSLLE